jgi:hypothetical protein
MSSAAAVFLIWSALGQLLLPRRWAMLPLLAGGCYLSTTLSLDVGPFHFYALRLLLTIAIVRMLLMREGIEGGLHALDWLMLSWAGAAIASSFFYDDSGAVLVNRLGMVYTACGVYFVLRVFCRSRDDMVRLCRMLALVLVPLGLAMAWERATGDNPFAALAGNSIPTIRGGEIRAQGPFAHPILAGSAGATSLPLMALLWKPHRTTARAGITACLAMVFTSGSSGPILSLAFAILGLLMWSMRDSMRLLRWSALMLYVAFDAVMQAPAYYLLARVDLTGNSTSWHRAALIETAIAHLPEWWLAGTDYTRHWLPYGVTWSNDNIDITNYYIRMGVDGGVLLMLLFIAVLWAGFSRVGEAWRALNGDPSLARTGVWPLGVCLFAHAVSFVSISYFDQSVLLLYLSLALIGSLPVTAPHAAAPGAAMNVPERLASPSPQARPERA